MLAPGIKALQADDRSSKSIMRIILDPSDFALGRARLSKLRGAQFVEKQGKGPVLFLISVANFVTRLL